MTQPVEVKETEVTVRGKLIERADGMGGSYVRFEHVKNGQLTHTDVEGLRAEDVRHDPS